MDAPLPTHLEKVFECIDPDVDRAIRLAKTLNTPKCGISGVRVMEHAVRVDKIERTIGERQGKQTRDHRMNKLHCGYRSAPSRSLRRHLGRGAPKHRAFAGAGSSASPIPPGGTSHALQSCR